MRTFDIYRHPDAGYQAVKRGFNWPAFLFVPLWAAFKRMWKLTALLFAVVFFLIYLQQGLRDAGLLWWSLAIYVPRIALHIVCGCYGNQWRRRFLLRQGYTQVTTRQDDNAYAAIFAHQKAQQELDTDIQKHAPKRRKWDISSQRR